MAAKLIFSRASTSKLMASPFLHPRIQSSASRIIPLPFQFLRYTNSICGFANGLSENNNSRNTRSMATSPDYDTPDAALGLDSRVPATVITGFLGSGKVCFPLTFII